MNWNEMECNTLIKKDNSLFRILKIENDMVFAIDCKNHRMPKWVDKEFFIDFTVCPEKDFIKDEENLSPKQKEIAHRRYTMISHILPFADDKLLRERAIKSLCDYEKISPQTIKKYLCKYLVYQDINALANMPHNNFKTISDDEKNIRWSLNKYFYSSLKYTLKRSYEIMIKERYCGDNGILFETYPSFHQYRYYYRTHKNLQTFYISRNGIKDYQKNHRPLLGNGIQDFAPTVGTGMIDSTICDIYLIDDANNIVGRPILTACVDAYSGLCIGYSLSWEGGVYSISHLLQNIILDKAEHCRKFGIEIEKENWNTDKLPGRFVTDMGKEYTSNTFEQISELGITIINLPAYRPELKGAIEKFFDVIQNLYKPQLKGKGVIEPDFMQRGCHDYRKDACLTLSDFEKIIIHCIIYYNTKRILENFPYTEDMLKSEIKPHSMNIFEYAKTQPGADLISVSKKDLAMTILPRTTGNFSRYGLKVNKLRYKNDDYTESYLSGGKCLVAYNPQNVSMVWVIENGKYIPFDLIDSRFEDYELDSVNNNLSKQKMIISSVKEENLQAKIDLMEHIKVISDKSNSRKTNTKNIRNTRRKEQIKAEIGSDFYG